MQQIKSKIYSVISKYLHSQLRKHFKKNQINLRLEKYL